MSRHTRPGRLARTFALTATAALVLGACGDGSSTPADLESQITSGLNSVSSQVSEQAGSIAANPEPVDQPEAEADTPGETVVEPAPAENPVGYFGGLDGAALADQSSRALRRLETLPVKGRAPKTGYSRDQFGPSWSDDVSVTYGRNGCDTRNDILKRDLKEIVYRDDDPGCTVATGILDDPFTGTTIEFTRGRGSSMDVQIDHLVALSDAWQKGAQQLSENKRRDFANDPRNLLAVDGRANQQKSDSDAASWLPKNQSFRCTYVSNQIKVKELYFLWVTQAEKDAMIKVLTPCANG